MKHDHKEQNIEASDITPSFRNQLRRAKSIFQFFFSLPFSLSLSSNQRNDKQDFAIKYWENIMPHVVLSLFLRYVASITWESTKSWKFT
jgi:hypothetical protein